MRGLVLAAIVALPCAAAAADVPGVRVKLIGEHDGTREYQLVFEPRAEIMSTLTDFILRNQLQSVHFTALGACSDAVVGYYDPARRDYRRTPYQQQMEIVSLVGDAAPSNGSAGLHAHIGLAFADGSMHGGHLFAAHAWPTLEMFLVASPTSVTRKHDAALNLDLLAP